MNSPTTNYHHIVHVKQLVTNSFGHKERLELLNYLEQLDKFDIIGKLPIALSTLVFEYFTPSELCPTRLVSQTWNKKITHDSIWRRHCIDYNMIPAATKSINSWNSNVPIFHDVFQRSMTMTKNWNSLDRCKRMELKYHTGPVLSMLIVNTTRIFTGDIDGKIHVWNSELAKYHVIQAHKSHVACLASSNNQYLASGSSDKCIKIHDINTLKTIKTLYGHDGSVTTLLFVKNELVQYLLSGSTDRTIRIYNVESTDCIRVLYGQENTINSLLYCKQFPINYSQSEMEFNSIINNKAGYLISASSNQNIFVWDLQQSIQKDIPKVINTIMQTNGPITSMSIYNESITSSTKNNNNTTNDYVCARLPINIPTFLAYAGIRDTTISIYSLPSLDKTFVETPNIHKGTIWSITSAVIHSKLITTSGDKTAIIWDLKHPKTSTTLAGFDSAVVSCSISPQEDVVCFGTENGSIVLFDLMESSSSSSSSSSFSC